MLNKRFSNEKTYFVAQEKYKTAQFRLFSQSGSFILQMHFSLIENCFHQEKRDTLQVGVVLPPNAGLTSDGARFDFYCLRALIQIRLERQEVDKK